MSYIQFLRIKKLTGKNIIEIAAKHNLRELQAERSAEHIDLSLSHTNVVLRGRDSAADVAGMARALLNNAEVIKTRKDAVQGLEIVFSLPTVMEIDASAFFADAVQWAENHFDAPVISAVIHNDESSLHCHVLILPLVRGRMIGSELMGNRTKLCAMQADFYEQVGQRYGLSRQTPSKRQSAAIRRDGAMLALNTIKAQPNVLNKRSVHDALVDAIARNPEPVMMALNMDMPKPKTKGTFVGIMTKPCKPDKPIGFNKHKPIGFAEAELPEKHQTLSCVGFANFATPKMVITPEPDCCFAMDYTRERESDKSSSYWNSERGEFSDQIRTVIL